MAIYPIQNEPFPINTHRILPVPRQGGLGEKTVQETSYIQGNESISGNPRGLAELQDINDRSNAAAQEKRNHDKIINRAEDYIDRMKAQLERILKNFPPFPPGSEERVQVLRSYVAFRKLIDRLTIPPREESMIETVKEPDERMPDRLQA